VVRIHDDGTADVFFWNKEKDTTAEVRLPLAALTLQ